MRLAVCWIAVLSLALAGAGCQRSSPVGGPTSPPIVRGDAALAAEALERGEYARAAELYQRALVSESSSVALHYGLGVSASHMDQRAIAIRELTWVLEHGDAGSDVVKAARRWLAAAGALPPTATAVAASAPVSAAVPDEPATRDPAQRPGTVRGRVLFGDAPGTVAPMSRMQLLLKEYPSAEHYFRLRTDEKGYFRFENVPPGTYQLTERVAGPPTWRLRVEVKPGEDVTRDLGPENSTRVRDDFPGLGSSIALPSS